MNLSSSPSGGHIFIKLICESYLFVPDKSFYFTFFRQALDDLKDNNKMQINLMTILADDYNSFSKEIVAVIAQQIMKVSISVWFKNSRWIAIYVT